MRSLLAILMAVSLSADAQDVTVAVMAQPKDAYGLVNSEVYLYASHDIEIINNSNQDRLFSYAYTMCPEFRRCDIIGNTITVNAHGHWNNHYDHHMSERYSFANNFSLAAKTYVTGEIDHVSDGYAGIIIR